MPDAPIIEGQTSKAEHGWEPSPTQQARGKEYYRFWVTTSYGGGGGGGGAKQLDVEMKANRIEGPRIVDGETVQVFGRLTSTGHVEANRVVHANGGVTRPRSGLSFATIVKVLVGAVVVIGMLIIGLLFVTLMLG